MPYMKPIAGHSSTKFIRYYLFKNNRALERDFINVPEFDYAGHPWDKAMDLTRERRGTDKPAKEGDKVRTYEHIIVSLDQKDAGVSLDDFRDFVTDWANDWFNDPNGIGRFQVAIAYHDDNTSRIAQGKAGILHAHLVINNVELDTNRRISGLLNRKAVQSLRADLQSRALGYGWHAFATNGESLTEEEMRRKHVRVSRGRDLDRRAEAIEDVLGEWALNRDISATEMAQVDEKLYKTYEVPKAIPETYRPQQKKAVTRKGDDKYAGFATATLYLEGGKTMQMIIPKAMASSKTTAEMDHYDREGWSWKDDIKGRVQIAKRVSQNPVEFADNLAQMGVTINYNRQGDLVYHHAGDPAARKVKGATLGSEFTASEVTQTLSGKFSARRQRAHNLNSRERWMDADERSAAMAVARAAEPGTKEGAALIARLQSAIYALDSAPKTDSGSHSNPNYPTSLASSLGIEYPKSSSSGRPRKRKLTEQEQLERMADIRAGKGWGGLEAANQEAPHVDNSTPHEDSSSDGARTQTKTH
mgnify:CR=1 FL=1